MSEKYSSRTNRKFVLKVFLKRFIPSYLILIIASVFYFHREHVVECERALLNERANFLLLKGKVKEGLEEAVSDLMFFSEMPDLYDLLDSDNKLYIKTQGIHLAQTYSNLLKHKHLYDQMRVINTSGRETIRVNYRAGDPYIVPHAKLQDKNQRDYFVDTINLDKGQVYISPLDLNVEQGRVEVPFKPMIRMGTPIFSRNGTRKGILIINFLAQKIINDIRVIYENGNSKPLLVNSEGFFMLGEDSSDEWTWMLKGKEHVLFKDKYPDTTLNGHASIKSVDGTFTTERMYPEDEGCNYLSQQTDEHLEPTHKIGHYWDIISYTPHSFYEQLKSNYFIKFVLTSFLGLIVTSLICIWTTKQAMSKKSIERELSKLFQSIEQSPISFIITDKNGIIEYANPGVIRQSGYQQQELIGKTPSILKAPKMIRKAEYKELWEVIKSGKTWSGELCNMRKDGNSYWVRTQISPIHDSDKNITHYVGINQDITEARRTRLELVKARDKAEVASKAKSEFLSNMSHEIRTPMNSILGFSELLNEDLKNTRHSEYLEIIQSSGINLLNLINDILDLSKIESGKMDLKPTPFEVKSLLLDMENLFSQSCRKKEIELTCVADDSVPAAIVLDYTRTRQIIVNLIGNAIKFTDAGRIKFEIKGEKSEDPHTNKFTLIMNIHDTGCGIPLEEQKQIFEAFEQQAEQNHAKYGGTGLGLAITQRLVRLMCGTISLQSTPRAGSTFSVTIPDVPPYNKMGPADTTVGFNPKKIEFEPATIVIADDTELNRRLYKDYLAHYNLKLLEAGTGKEVIEKVKNNNPDLVIMDLKMPVMDGLEAIQEIRKYPEHKNLPVIGLTASVFKYDTKEFAAAVDSLINKPVKHQELVKTLCQHLPHSNHTEEKNKKTKKCNNQQKAHISKELKKILSDKISDKLTTQDSLSIREYKEMGQVIYKLGEKNSAIALIEYGSDLIDAAEAFDMVSLKDITKALKQTIG